MHPRRRRHLFHRYKYWRTRLREGLLLPWGGARALGARLAGRFRVRRLELPCPALPAGLEGFTVTHLTDLHCGPNADPRQHLPPVVEAVRGLGSDLIAITGDWVDHRLDWLDVAAPYLRELEAPLGVWGVLGNHDLLENKARMVRRLRDLLGERLLLNNAAVLGRGGARLGLLGLDFAYGNTRWRRHLARARARLAALGPAPDFLLALAHDPDLWDPLRAQAGADLTLSGHTHGGQIALQPEPAPSIGAAFNFKYRRGLYQKDGKYLYVSNGLAQSIPVRWNCPTEVVQLTLLRAEEVSSADFANDAD
ncbi:MAG: metallophosphoesterase [Verrucomicrobiota bacterium]